MNNKWRADVFLKSTALLTLIRNELIVSDGGDARTILEAMNETNIQETIDIGGIKYDDAEPNIGDATDTKATALTAQALTMKVKTQWRNQWWLLTNFSKVVYNKAGSASTSIEEKLVEAIGELWSFFFQQAMAATINGLALTADFINANPIVNASGAGMLERLSKWGVAGLMNNYYIAMNTTTLIDIVQKQKAGTINETLISKIDNTLMQTLLVMANGGSGLESENKINAPFQWVWEGVTPIYINNDIKDGTIALMKRGAFIFSQSNKEDIKALIYEKEEREGTGAGNSYVGSRGLYVLHPQGTTFKLSTADGTIAKKQGATNAELGKADAYGILDTVERSYILIYKVKIG